MAGTAGLGQSCPYRLPPHSVNAQCWRVAHVARQRQTLLTTRAKRQIIAASTPVEVATAEDASAKQQKKAEGSEKRMAVAAKIRAARALARKLANEQQAAVSAAQAAAGHSLDEEEIEAIKRSVEASSAAAAREAARAAAKERQTRKASNITSEQAAELARLKAENEALQRLVLEVAANKKEAKQRVAGLREKYEDLVSQVPESFSTGNVASQALQAEAEAAANALATSSHKEEEILKVVTSIAAAREALHREAKSPSSLKSLAQAAMRDSLSIFLRPPHGIPSGDSGTLYYNTTVSPLPYGARPRLKAGINKWQDIQEFPMQKVDELVGLGDSDWWSVNLSFSEDVFRVDFVVVDENSGAVDNNRGNDFELQLYGALTQEQILERQATLLAEMEERRLQTVEAEEDRLWDEQMAAAFRLADQAREQYKHQFEADLWTEAAEIVAERRGAKLAAIKPQNSFPGVISWAGDGPQSGKTATLLYNKAYGALRHQSGVIVHLGFDAWYPDSLMQIELSPLPDKEKRKYNLEGDWWAGSFEIPRIAAVLDFVLSDPEKNTWENNGNQDFHIRIKGSLSREQLIEMTFKGAWESRQADLQEGQDRAAKRTIRQLEQKAKAMRRRRELQRQIFYTEPATPVAGQPVDIFYNADITNLRGRPEIWITGSFNRWAHGTLIGPAQMQSVIPGGVGFHKITVQVPSDAWMMDFVFGDSSSTQSGGFFDNNNGWDYHIDVAGSSIAPPKLNVVHIAVEMAPIAKVGGMGDVVTALSRAVQDEGHNVKVILPKYDIINYAEVKQLVQIGDFFWNNTQVKVWQGLVEGMTTVFLEPCNGMVWAGCIYGRNDDAARFGFFCDAALEFLKHHSQEPMPDILHAHDWQSAPVTFSDVHPAKTVFTIHNMEFRVDLIGRAVASSAVSTTVSPTYALEVSGHPAVAPHLQKFYGIRNGIDQEIWDPLFDKFLPMAYSSDNAAEGKAAAKAELRRRMDLSAADAPLVSVVTRLTHQKGIHLIKHACWRTLERGGQFMLLGSAPDPRVQGEFNALAGEVARQYPDRARFWFAYDEPLSHLIYAGSDLFLVPSVFEPCGLTQMIAMRYGTVPVVRKTGGLNDTVFDVDDDVDRALYAGMEPNGYSFVGADPAGLDYALNRALQAWYTDQESWATLTRRVMQQDWSWAEPALDYIEVYFKALKGM